MPEELEETVLDEDVVCLCSNIEILSEIGFLPGPEREAMVKVWMGVFKFDDSLLNSQELAASISIYSALTNRCLFTHYLLLL